ncbi:hypothetical protein WICPIJ_000930 [Wickerhamomyces pijperi]|uniref:Uncharacterized protein n=1 Tax=Wickerhamomyces pijperi TaxID=599730 RepID=A0A9P8QBW0_WICPI|nr:hypothetical protein WICPIJ_000930 [Wickerhamomyces pijperi]
MLVLSKILEMFPLSTSHLFKNLTPFDTEILQVDDFRAVRLVIDDFGENGTFKSWKERPKDLLGLSHCGLIGLFFGIELFDFTVNLRFGCN